MNAILVYYSHTGNNAVLAEYVAKQVGIKSFRIEDVKKREIKDIAIEMLFGINPKLKAMPEKLDEYDLVLFMSPIWMFSIPSPMRSIMKQYKGKLKKYAFISFSGGALGPNTKIAKELVKRLGKNMAFQLDLTIAQFCEKLASEATESAEYSLVENETDLEKLSQTIVSAISALKLEPLPVLASTP